MDIWDILLIFIVYIVGTLLSLILTGLLANRLVVQKVIKKVMANEEIKDTIRVFREGKEYLKQILENQKHEH